MYMVSLSVISYFNGMNWLDFFSFDYEYLKVYSNGIF